MIGPSWWVCVNSHRDRAEQSYEIRSGKYAPVRGRVGKVQSSAASGKDGVARNEQPGADAKLFARYLSVHEQNHASR